MTIEAMKQALEALEELNKVSIGVDAVCLPGEIDTAMDALRTAIEQAEKQEPVAWLYDFLNPDNRDEVIRNWTTQDYDDIEREKGFNVRPLYTTPPAAPVQELRMYEDWYDPASCSYCGIINGHTQNCRTVTRTAATKIRKYEPTIDLGKYAGTYGGYIKENDND